mgnify:FL=1
MYTNTRLSIDINKSEIDVLRLAVESLLAEWQDYQSARRFDDQTLELNKRVLLLKSLSRRFAVLACIPIPTP